MSVLAPLYLLGALAVSLPVLLHLIRRTPRGRQTFSSLMFLSPSPPRITRRSRIEHWLLLLMRAAALILLACAFARPFVRESAVLLGNSEPGKRIAIVMDTSASMRRGDLWRQAVAKADKVLADSGPTDQLALFAFDDTTRLLVDSNEPLADPTARRARIKSALAELAPGWGSTDLGRALATVADRLSAEAAEQNGGRAAQIILITDRQQGSNTAALQAYQWPSEVALQIEPLRAKSADNAGIRLLANDDGAGWRVRVSNAIGATREQFRVEWGSPTLAAGKGEGITVYVPSGQSRVARMPDPPPQSDRVRLSGDAHAFDNEFYIAPVPQQELQIVYVGSDKPDDVDGLRYFLDRIWTETPRRKVVVQSHSLESLAAPSPDGPRSLVVISSPLNPQQIEALRGFVDKGGAALLVVSESETARSLVQVGAGVELAESTKDAPSSGGYSLLGQIDFEHPVFASLAGPRYNDFTKVRFWRHQRFAVDDTAAATILARFDNGDPAIWEQSLGKGKVLWLACGWRPADSQLALSSKFVPLLSAMLDHLTGTDDLSTSGYRVHQRITLPASVDKTAASVTRPDSQVAMLAPDAGVFENTDQPGIYRLQRGATALDFAVNLAPQESDTSELAADHLQQLGVQVGAQPSREQQLDRQRQMRDIELESRQKLWKWLLVAVLGVLAVETSLASRLARRTEPTESES